MNPRRNLQGKRSVWAAISLLLLQALFPALIHAAASLNPGSEICSAYGIKKVFADDGSSSGTQASAQHCPVCALAHVDVLPVGGIARVYADAFTVVPVSSLPAWQLVDASRRPNLRGPPRA
jgi:hypothetical protein